MSIEKENKVRIICSDCLYTKLLDRIEDDPKNTRFIISNCCEKCSQHEVSLRYFNSDMYELTELPATPSGVDDGRK